MAPVPDSDSSSILSTLGTLLRRVPRPNTIPLVLDRQILLPRDDSANPGAVGVTAPDSINNTAVFAVFGLIGAGFVITGIWFFFWAKNGGFYFKENDWEDYKSTVLRRKGPNGTTLSGATASTDLGGGSVVHGEKNSRWGRGRKGKKGQKRYKDFEEGSEISGSAGGSTLGSEMSELKWKAKEANRKKQAKRDTRLRGGGLDDGMGDEEMDVGVVDAMRAYRHEKPARVGGLNKHADGSAFDGSTNDNTTAASELLSNRETTPTNTPVKVKKQRPDNYTGGTGGIRKVVSTSGPTSSFWNRAGGIDKRTREEEDRIKTAAKKLQEKGRAAQRRDFSFSVGDDGSTGSTASVSGLTEEERRLRREQRDARRASRSATKLPGSYYEESVVGSDVSGDLGTKAYHHPIPGLSTTGSSDYAEERRKKRGYRRDEN